MAYLYLRGPGAKRRVMHIAHYDQFGRIDRAWCWRAQYNTAINVPLARPRCKVCIRRMNAA